MKINLTTIIRQALTSLGWGIGGLVFLSSCGSSTSPDVDGGDTLKLKYSQLLTIVKHERYVQVKVADPWNKGKTLHTYLLVPRADSSRAIHLPEGTVVYTPVKRSVVFTTAHCQLLQYLKSTDAIKGVCDLPYILIPDIQQRARSGKIADCGNGMSPIVEKIISLRPQAMLLSPFENSGGYGKLQQIDIPIIECADYMETSALGRAEWTRFYGMLYGQEHRSDSLFHVVDSTFQSLRNMAKMLPQGRSIITERKTGAVWYCPGGRSTVGQMIADANGRYAFANDRHSGSLALPFEQVLEKAGHTDVWAFKYNGNHPMSRADLLAEYHGYKGLHAFCAGEIYECNCSTIPYFEQVPFRPDFLLRELIILLHPNVKTLGKQRYYVHI